MGEPVGEKKLHSIRRAFTPLHGCTLNIDVGWPTEMGKPTLIISIEAESYSRLPLVVQIDNLIRELEEMRKAVL